MKPVIEITFEEWKELTPEQKEKYPPVFDGKCDISHSNYYICALHEHVMNGGQINKRVWESLPELYKDQLWRAYRKFTND